MRRIKDWPADERPREKLLNRGAESLSDAELLALILRTGDACSGFTAVDMARDLLSRFGSLRELAMAGTTELCRLRGIGPAKAAELQAVFQLARRFSGSCLQPGERYLSSGDAFSHFHERLRDLRKEIFLALLLDSKNRLLREVRISEGSLNASIVHPREVFAAVVRDSAAAVLFVHNHPSGDPAPSRADIEMTGRIVDAAKPMGIVVHDHIIIGKGNHTSLKAMGCI